MSAVLSRFLTIVAITVSASMASAGAEFIRFKTWDEALKYYEETAPIISNITGEPVHHAIPRANAPYDRVEKMIAAVTSGFSKYFPVVKAQNAPPYVLIVNDPEKNAFAMRDPRTEKNPYVFVINSGILSMSDAALTGIVAHELTHLFMQYSSNGVQVPALKYYLHTPGAAEFGPRIVNNSAVQANAEQLFYLYSEVGPFSNPELGEIPLSYTEILNFRLMQVLLAAGSNKQECKDATQSYKDLITVVFSNLNRATIRLDIKDQTVAAKVQALSTAISKGARTCLAGSKVPYDLLLQTAYSIPSDVWANLKSKMSPLEKAEYDKAAKEFETRDAVDIILSSTKEGRDGMRVLESRIDMKRLRIFTAEDDADELGVYITMQAGLNPDGLSESLQSITGEKCSLTTEPAVYGPIEEPHHETCWRVYRNTQYKNYLATLSPVERDNLYTTRRGFARPMMSFRQSLLSLTGHGTFTGNYKKKSKKH